MNVRSEALEKQPVTPRGQNLLEQLKEALNNKKEGIPSLDQLPGAPANSKQPNNHKVAANIPDIFKEGVIV